MIPRRLTAICIALVGLSLGCAESTGPAPELVRDTRALFQTDSITYTLRARGRWFEGRIDFELTNRTSAPIAILENCRGATYGSFERFEGIAWRSVWTQQINDCGASAIVVAQDESYTNSLPIAVADAGQNASPSGPAAELSGLFRIVWVGVGRGEASNPNAAGPLLPSSQRVSNAFWLSFER